MCWLRKKPTPAPVSDLLQEYRDDYTQCHVLTTWLAEASFAAKRIRLGMDRYQRVGDKVGCPAYVVGLIHLMESDCDFETHLWNGDPLTARTVHFPPGKPETCGDPPYKWEDSAAEALVYDEIARFNLAETGLAGDLNFLESYNGRGYRNLDQPIKTPYLWSGTDLYTAGKFVEVWDDSQKKYIPVFRNEVVSKQIGCVAVMKAMGI